MENRQKLRELLDAIWHTISVQDDPASMAAVVYLSPDDDGKVDEQVLVVGGSHMTPELVAEYARLIRQAIMLATTTIERRAAQQENTPRA